MTKQALRIQSPLREFYLVQVPIFFNSQVFCDIPTEQNAYGFFIYFSCNEARYDELCHGTSKTSYLFTVRGWEQAVIQRREEISCFAHELTQEISETKKHSNCLFKQGLNCSSRDSAFS